MILLVKEDIVIAVMLNENGNKLTFIFWKIYAKSNCQRVQKSVKNGSHEENLKHPHHKAVMEFRK
jgi:hypothetical protein|tara:strand:- start:471 stop:665 length:195 start_codon:yes stop_codon:yes gene_type:complete